MMNQTTVFVNRCSCGIIAVMAFAADTAALARGLSIDVHARGQAEVLETRAVVLNGESTAITWAPVSSRLDLDTLRFTVPGTSTPWPVSDARVENDLVNRDALLRRYVGKTVHLLRPETGVLVSGTLMAAGQGRPTMLRRGDGSLLLDPVGELVLPSDPALAAEPTLRCRLMTALNGNHDVRLAYRTGGLKWQSVYAITADEKKGTVDLSATLIVQNETEIDFSDAAWRFFSTERMKVRLPEPAEYDTVVEFRPLQSLENVSLPARDSLRLPLVEARNLPVATAFVFDPMADGPRVDSPAQKLQRVIFIANTPTDDAVGLGEPLPSGKAKVSLREPSGFVEALGEQHVGFAAAGDMIQIALGAARGLTGKRTQTPFVELAAERAQEQVVTIRLRNDTNAEVLATVFEHPWGRWEIPSSTPDFEQLDNETIRFMVSIPAGDEAEVGYTVRIKY